MILRDNPNNIYFNIKFNKPVDYSNDNLLLLYGIYPKCINTKSELCCYLKEEIIQSFESEGLITFYQNGEKIM